MDTIIYNAKVLREDFSYSEAVAVKDGLVALVGTNDEVLAAKTNTTELIDAKGQLVMPGFNDSHQHLYNMGTFLSNCNLYNANSVDEIVERGRAYIEEKQLPTGKLLSGWGWNQDYFEGEKRLLNRHDLDRISTEHPIVFRRACGHVSGANTKAIEMIGLTGASPQVEGGVFELGDDGEPNGVFNENAQVLLKELEETLSVETIKEKIMTAAEYATSLGITTVQSNDLSLESVEFPYMYQAFRELVDEGKLPVRIYMQCTFPDPEELKKFISKGNVTHAGDEMLRVGPLKLFVDGSLGARTALMRKPYNDDPSTKGVEVLTQEQIDTLVKIADENNMQVAIHAIGDEAINRVLTSYERVYQEERGNNLRHGIIHCQITDIPMLERFKKYDVMAYVQPIFLHYDMHMVEDRVGKELADTSYAFGTMEKMGITTSYGTDAPVEDMHPFNNLHCAINRQDLKGNPAGGYNPAECVSVEKAIERYTMGSAYCEHREDKKGSLEVGKYADMIILDQNLLEIDKSKIKDTKVQLTMLNGKVVYTA